MNQNKLYTKSVSTTLVVVLAVALVVALGFIYWQNFIHKPVTMQQIIKVEATSPKAVAKMQTRYLMLEKWNVRVPLKVDSYYYQPGDYSVVSSSDEVYKLSTKSLRVACGTDKATIGSLERVLNNADGKQKAVASRVAATKVLGDYLYVFTRPKSVCSDSIDVITLQENATREFVDLLGSIQAT